MRNKRRPKAQPTRRLAMKSVRVLGAPPCQDECDRAFVILKHTQKPADALLKAFELARKRRASGPVPVRGMSTDDEQDLLRAMLVMTAAGVDSMMKQLVRDTIPLLAKKDAVVRNGMTQYVATRLRTESET